MESNAKQIRKKFKELLDDGQPHSRKELFAYAKEDVEENAYTIGMLTGALKSLVDSSDIYQSMGRGIYQKVELSEKSSNKISARYLNIFKRTLEEYVDKVNIEKRKKIFYLLFAIFPSARLAKLILK